MDLSYIKSTVLSGSQRAINNLINDPDFLASGGQLLMKTASLLRNDGYYSECLRVIDIIEAQCKGDVLVKARYLKADVCLDTENYQDAISCYNGIVADCETDTAYSNRGLAYWSLRRYNEALCDYRRAVELNPDNSVAHRGAGEMCLELGLVDEAVTYFENAIKIDPEYVEALVGSGLAFYRSKQWVKSYKRLLAASKLDPLNDLANRGICAIEKNFDIAEEVNSGRLD